MSGNPPDDSAREGLDETGRLIAAAAMGNREAWETLYGRFRPFLAFLTSSRIPAHLRNRFDTDDVVQSAFLSAFRSLSEFEYRGEESFRSWLKQISLRQLQERIRANGRERRTPDKEQTGIDPDQLVDPGGAGQTPSVILQNAERSAEILEAISRLTPAEQEILWMRDFEHRPWEEIASLLHCQDSTARRRHGEALEALLRRLA